MPVYSDSKLTTYENCPQQYKLRYIDRLKIPEAGETVEAFLGHRVHETLEKLHKELILTKLNSLEDLLEYYRGKWAKNWNNNVVITKKGFKKDHYKGAGVEALKNYYTCYHPFNQSKTLATEYKVFFKIGEYTIQGIIDRLSHTGRGVYEIHDYKASGYLQSQDTLDNDRQLALYQIGIRDKFRDAKKVNLIWHFLLFDKEFVSTRSDAQLTDVKKQTISLIKTIEKDTRFNPNRSQLCDWCEFPGYCPAMKHEVSVEPLPLNKYLKDAGVSLVNKYVSIASDIQDLKKREKELQKELGLIADAAIKFAQMKGITAITARDYLLKIIEDEVLRFPHANEEGRDEFEKCIKRVGIWEDVSGLDLRRLTKMFEMEEFDRRIINRLSHFAEILDQTSVKLVRKKPDDE
ncbi:MAG: hypothetical protein A2156_01085 [Deltaproteobacteria bacterium RBG_16_48_10]|nr:MAG: hypothetical protein A2156_01085 [Deltaproteobacteria bacterium RBG_16_48_10]